jgi:membrane protease YdiL (CAAX protease family)
VDAVALVVLVNLAAAEELRARGRDLTVNRAFGALALVAAVTVAAAALPLQHISEAAGTIIVALLASGACFYFASRQELELRVSFAPSEAGVRATIIVVAVTAASVAFGFSAYLLRAPTLSTHGFGGTLIALAALTFAAVGEELLFRGVLQGSLAQSLGVTAGVVVAGLLSAALSTTVGWWLIPAIFASLSFGLVVAVTGTLGPAILAHIGFLVGATVVWPRVLERSPPALPAWAPAAIILGGAILVALAADRLPTERGDV